MLKDITIKDKYPVQSDDLKFDGKSVIIPSYYVDSLIDYLKATSLTGMSQADVEDFAMFKSFLYDIQEYKNKGN
jgi:hypothetical protein